MATTVRFRRGDGPGIRARRARARGRRSRISDAAPRPARMWCRGDRSRLARAPGAAEEPMWSRRWDDLSPAKKVAVISRLLAGRLLVSEGGREANFPGSCPDPGVEAPPSSSVGRARPPPCWGSAGTMRGAYRGPGGRRLRPCARRRPAGVGQSVRTRHRSSTARASTPGSLLGLPRVRLTSLSPGVPGAGRVFSCPRRVARRGELIQDEVATDFGISVESVRRWVRQADIDDDIAAAEQNELVQLRPGRRERD